MFFFGRRKKSSQYQFLRFQVLIYIFFPGSVTNIIHSTRINIDNISLATDFKNLIKITTRVYIFTCAHFITSCAFARIGNALGACGRRT